MTHNPLNDRQLDEITRAVAATFDQHEPAETRQARWEAAALAAGRAVDRNALAVYMAVADAELKALAADWARSVASTDAEIRRLRAELAANRAQAWRDLADRADPQRPEISFFGDHGHEVGAWMRMQAEYEDRNAAVRPAVETGA